MNNKILPLCKREIKGDFYKNPSLTLPFTKGENITGII